MNNNKDCRVGGRVERRPHRAGERGVDVACHVPVQVGQSGAAAQPGGEAASLRVGSGVEVFLSLRPRFL